MKAVKNHRVKTHQKFPYDEDFHILQPLFLPIWISVLGTGAVRDLMFSQILSDISAVQILPPALPPSRPSAAPQMHQYNNMERSRVLNIVVGWSDTTQLHSGKLMHPSEGHGSWMASLISVGAGQEGVSCPASWAEGRRPGLLPDFFMACPREMYF